jgi:tetratricopeptide (TPR) repeat protein/predicted aspartyl protease
MGHAATMTRERLLLATAALLALLPGAASAACRMTRIVEMPVTMHGLVPIVSGQINGHDAHFIADSGGFYSLLTAEAAKRFETPLKSGPVNLVVAGAGGLENMQITRVKDFTLLGHTYHGVEFMVGASFINAEADGLLGQNFLRAADAEFDLASGAIRLFKSEDCDAVAPTYWSASKPEAVQMMRIADTDAADSHIRGEAWVNGHKIQVLFDTGAPQSILSLVTAEHMGLSAKTPGAEPAGLTGGIGRGRAQSWTVPVDSFEVGGEKVLRTRLRIADAGLAGEDMLIGADFFLSHRVYVSYRRRLLFFTYNGGPVFDLSHHDAAGAADVAAAGAASPGEAPKDASGFARRGAARAARNQDDLALADYDKAIELEPSSTDYLLQRAELQVRREKPDLARADLDRLLKLKPDHLLALELRGRVLLDLHQPDAARADLDAAWKAGAGDPDLGLRIAELYEEKDQFQDAVSSFDRWLGEHAHDKREALALNGRCWTRALWNRDLDRALADCNRAVDLDPFTYDSRDSRALVWLRMNQPARAIGDYNAVLNRTGKNAWSLYGRGVAELRKGDAARGQADIAAADKLEPKVTERARALGITR